MVSELVNLLTNTQGIIFCVDNLNPVKTEAAGTFWTFYLQLMMCFGL